VARSTDSSCGGAVEEVSGGNGWVLL